MSNVNYEAPQSLEDLKSRIAELEVENAQLKSSLEKNDTNDEEVDYPFDEEPHFPKDHTDTPRGFFIESDDWTATLRMLAVNEYGIFKMGSNRSCLIQAVGRAATKGKNYVYVFNNGSVLVHRISDEASNREKHDARKSLRNIANDLMISEERPLKKINCSQTIMQIPMGETRRFLFIRQEECNRFVIAASAFNYNKMKDGKLDRCSVKIIGPYELLVEHHM